MNPFAGCFVDRMHDYITPAKGILDLGNAFVFRWDNNETAEDATKWLGAVAELLGFGELSPTSRNQREGRYAGKQLGKHCRYVENRPWRRVVLSYLNNDNRKTKKQRKMEAKHANF